MNMTCNGSERTHLDITERNRGSEFGIKKNVRLDYFDSPSVDALSK